MNFVHHTLFLLLMPLMALAQDSLSTHIGYDLQTEMAVGSGDYTAYQLVTNRHHALGIRSNTAYLRGAMDITHHFSPHLTLTGKVDAIASVHADHKVYLQQCYANLSYKNFFIEAGAREEKPVMRDEQLSVGSFIKGTNAKPIPQIHFGTNGFWTVPYTKQWLQINFDFGYGHFLDGGYKERMFEGSSNVNPSYTDKVWYHQKHLYFRSNPNKRFFGVIGIEHAVQMGGTKHYYADGVLQETSKKANLKTFLKVILPLGNSDYYSENVLEDWVYGNHVGVMTYQIGWNINKDHQLQAYLDNIFEDGSGIRKGNGWDGLWGLEYKNKKSGRQYVRSVVLEYFQSTNQCGPLHWDPGDYPEPVKSQITSMVTGNDNYYNHMYYDSYAHYGMTPGIALITSPIYNKDGFLGYRDNRIKAWHVGINGEITPRLSYLVKGSYREGWGTYNIPIYPKTHTFDAMVQGTYLLNSWTFTAAYAFDKGTVYGDNSTFNIKIGYHGKIL